MPFLLPFVTTEISITFSVACRLTQLTKNNNLMRQKTNCLSPGDSAGQCDFFDYGLHDLKKKMIRKLLWYLDAKERSLPVLENRDIYSLEIQTLFLGITLNRPIVFDKPNIIPIDYRCDNSRFWLSAHNCQVLTPTSQNLELEQQIRIFGAD